MSKVAEVLERHRQRCEREATRDVIFLFQVRRWIRTGLPDGYDTDGESIWKSDDDTEGPEHLEWSELQSMENDDGLPYMLERWDTEGVWLDRDEAEAFGRAKSYNYSDGWRVYGVPANGELAAMLRGERPTAARKESGE